MALHELVAQPGKRIHTFDSNAIALRASGVTAREAVESGMTYAVHLQSTILAAKFIGSTHKRLRPALAFAELLRRHGHEPVVIALGGQDEARVFCRVRPSHFWRQAAEAWTGRVICGENETIEPPLCPQPLSYRVHLISPLTVAEAIDHLRPIRAAAYPEILPGMNEGPG